MKRIWISFRRTCVRTFATLGLAVMLVTFTPLVGWWARELAGPWTDPRGDVLIVLTGDIVSNGILGETSYWRSAYTVMTWREGGWRQVIVSGGGDGAASLPAGEAMKIFLEAGGIPSGAILDESQSMTTRESALNLARILQQIPGRKILLTSDYHMYRAVRALRKAGITVIPRPIPDAGKRALKWNLRWEVFQDLLIESSKIAYYRSRGWI